MGNNPQTESNERAVGDWSPLGRGPVTPIFEADSLGLTHQPVIPEEKHFRGLWVNAKSPQ